VRYPPKCGIQCCAHCLADLLAAAHGNNVDRELAGLDAVTRVDGDAATGCGSSSVTVMHQPILHSRTVTAMVTQFLEQSLDLTTRNVLVGLHVVGEHTQTVAVRVQAIVAAPALGARNELAVLPSAIVVYNPCKQTRPGPCSGRSKAMDLPI